MDRLETGPVKETAAPPESDARRGVVMPSYNSGRLLAATVREVLAVWRPVIVVVDGSTDGSGAEVADLAAAIPGLHLLESFENQGKGCAIASGLRFAADLGLTHAAVFDADGQHHAPDLPRFMEASRREPEAMILGVPIFGPDAPRVRIAGHVLANFFSAVETCGGGIGDSLFGFRVYPVMPALEVFRQMRGGRGFDAETQLAVRLCWSGIRAVDVPTPVRYRAAADGGISHFRYLRDNLVLVRAHAALLAGAARRYPSLALRRLKSAISRARGSSGSGPGEAGGSGVGRLEEMVQENPEEARRPHDEEHRAE